MVVDRLENGVAEVCYPLDCCNAKATTQRSCFSRGFVQERKCRNMWLWADWDGKLA